MKTNLLKTYQYIFFRQGFLIRFFIILAILLGVIYSILVVRTIHTIGDRKEARIAIRDTQSRISELEKKYFELAQGIDTSYVTQMGFTEVQEPVFAYLQDSYDNSTNALAINTLENRLK